MVYITVQQPAAAQLCSVQLYQLDEVYMMCYKLLQLLVATRPVGARCSAGLSLIEVIHALVQQQQLSSAQSANIDTAESAAFKL
jgi:hypothetical protein